MKKTIKDIDIKNKRLLIRVDFNVPLDEDLKVSDDSRIRASLPTINYCLERGSKIILMSHLGRPDGKVVEKMRLTPTAKRLAELMGKEVKKTDDCIGDAAKKAFANLKEGEILLLENLRFHPEEEENNSDFARELSHYGEIFVNDAFSAAHRAHASTTGVAKFLPSVAGLLMEKEILYLEKLLHEPAHPFVVILGGAKIADKIGVIENIAKKLDSLIIGGAMASTFLKAQGKEMGSSKVEMEKLDIAVTLLKNIGSALLLPTDLVIANRFSRDAETRNTEAGNIPDDWMAMDIGSRSITRFCEVLKGAKTVLWNGPVGVFEMSPFAKGTEAIARFLSQLDATVVIGGGDTVSAIRHFGLTDCYSHVSTGGGASLEFLEGKTLPGIAVLEDKDSCN
jgi:phosphoglycerate kinase